jgi:hypothetical protein
MAYSAEGVESLLREKRSLRPEYQRLLLEFISQFGGSRAKEYAVHGFLRRLGTLIRCIENVYNLYAPERSDIPTKDVLNDVAINLQSFIFNTFGCIENLAWIWVILAEIKNDKGKALKPTQVSFQNEIVLKSLTVDFQDYLRSRETWISYLTEFRHALAHRIPIYVPPYAVDPKRSEEYAEMEQRKTAALRRGNVRAYEQLDAQQDALGWFNPVMIHSYETSSGAPSFHEQPLVDFKTVVELADAFRAQFDEGGKLKVGGLVDSRFATEAVGAPTMASS